jgi:hypothetical protein
MVLLLCSEQWSTAIPKVAVPLGMGAPSSRGWTVPGCVRQTGDVQTGANTEVAVLTWIS